MGGHNIIEPCWYGVPTLFGPNMNNQLELVDLVKKYQSGIQLEIEDLQKTVEDDKTSVDLVRAALKEAVFNNKTNWKYIQAILRNWRREGITTVAQVEAKNIERDIQNPKNVTVSSDFLDAMNLWKE